MHSEGLLSEVRQRLVWLGLEPELAETYLRLLLMGRARPAAVAQAAGVSRAEAYRRLARLAEAGLAHALQDGPLAYEALAPRLLFRALQETGLRRARLLGDAVREVQDGDGPWQAYTDVSATFRRLAGRAAVYHEIHRMLAGAHEEVLTVNTHAHAAGLAQQANLWPAVAAAVERGAAFRALLAAPALAPEGLRGTVRLLPSDEVVRFVVVDRQEALLCTTVDLSADIAAPLEQAVITGAPGFVAAYTLLFDHLWGQARAVQEGMRHAMGKR